MKFDNILIKTVSIILFAWSLVNTYLFFNHIPVEGYSYTMFVSVLALVMVFFNWSILNKENEQSFVNLLNSSPIEFLIRLITVILAIVITTVSLNVMSGLFIILFLLNDAFLYYPQKNTFNTGKPLIGTILILIGFIWGLI